MLDVPFKTYSKEGPMDDIAEYHRTHASSSAKAEFKSAAVFGLGYIGLPTAALIASRGIHVLGIDVNEDVVRKISSGAVHIYEPDLDGLVQKVISTGALKVSMQPEPSDAFIIAVPTPISAEKAPVLDSVFTAVRAIAPLL